MLNPTVKSQTAASPTTTSILKSSSPGQATPTSVQTTPMTTSAAQVAQRLLIVCSNSYAIVFGPMVNMASTATHPDVAYASFLVGVIARAANISNVSRVVSVSVFSESNLGESIGLPWNFSSRVLSQFITNYQTYPRNNIAKNRGVKGNAVRFNL